MKIQILLILLLVSWISPAQTPAIRPLGCLREKSQYQQVPLPPEAGKGSILPDSVSWKAFAPEVGDQGYKLNSCVGWAASYLMTMQEAIYMGPDHSDRVCLKELQFSASYLYNKIKAKVDCASGAYLSKALELITGAGICRESDFPNSQVHCDPPSPAVDARLPKYYGSGYHKLFDEDDALQEKIREVKRMLASGKPVVVAMEITNSFFDEKGDSWQPGAKEPHYDLLHTVVVVGYNGKHFEMLNSYGKNWKNQGFFYMSHGDFARQALYAYIVCQDPSGNCFSKGGEAASARLYAYATIEKLAKDGQYREINIQRSAPDSGLYEVGNDTLTTADWLKVNFKELPDGVFLYLLNVNPSERCTLLANLGPESGLTDGSSIKDLYLEKGRERLIFLLARHPITNMEQKLHAFDQCSGNTMDKLRCAFGVDPAELGNCLFSKDKLLAIAKTGDIQPLILPIILDIQVSE